MFVAQTQGKILVYYSTYYVQLFMYMHTLDIDGISILYLP
jgi:hypothetical protein